MTTTSPTVTTLLTVMPAGTSHEATPGTTLLEALRRAGVMSHECDGGAVCAARCHLFVLEGRKSLSKAQRAENEKLDTIVGVSSKSRLACQAVLGEEPVTVEILSFV